MAGGKEEGRKAVSALPQPYFESPDRRFRLYQGDCLALLPLIPAETFDLVFADPPYFLSNDGITCHAGRMVSVNKGKWDRSRGFRGNYEFTRRWLAACRRVMKPGATIWVSGTSHIIHIVGCCLEELGFKILNDITWVKPNPPPNLSCRYFTHATETVIWARREPKRKHTFNYQLMKRLNGGKQMTSVWTIPAPGREEKVFGKHPTQKPLALLERIILASSRENDLVLDPFAGSGTTGIAAARLNRPFMGCDLQRKFLTTTVFRLLGVPQADRPERILSVTERHLDGVPSAGRLSEEEGITKRQVHYYRQAAAFLRLLEPSGLAWTPTERTREICRMPRSERKRTVARLILEHPLVVLAVRRMRRWRRAGSQSRAIADLLGRSPALSPGICKRRARTLLSWIEWARTLWEPGKENSQQKVSSAPEELQNTPIP